MNSIDFKTLQTKKDFHEALKGIMELPDYYGNNLDALYDVLTEVSKPLELSFLIEKDESVYSEEIQKLISGLRRMSEDIMSENENVTITWLDAANEVEPAEVNRIIETKGVNKVKERIDTKCVQAGYTPGNGEPRQIPIYQSTTFKYETGAAMGQLFDLEASGYFYTRLQNPTNDYVAAKIAAMEGGTAAMLTSSGQAANFYALFNICEAGDHIVSSSSIYGGTFNLISVTMARMGIETTFISPDCSEEELKAAFKENTKVLFGETIANPALTVLDIEMFAKVAHEMGVPFVIDNTFATPVNCRPIEWGADIVTHSTTKYMDGHGATVGGAIVDAGKFDWMKYKDKYPGLTTPDESYHGIVYAEKFGLEGAFITKCTAQLMRDLGSIQSPQNAFLLNLGLESLHVRMPKHVENGQAVAEYLLNHPRVVSVRYPGLPGDEYYDRAMKYMGNGGCGVVSFEIEGGREAAERFMNSLKLVAIETHVADARSCCLNPATTTHRQMTDEQLNDAGIPAGLIRLSCGIEAAEDIIADLDQAFNA